LLLVRNRCEGPASGVFRISTCGANGAVGNVVTEPMELAAHLGAYKVIDGAPPPLGVLAMGGVVERAVPAAPQPQRPARGGAGL